MQNIGFIIVISFLILVMLFIMFKPIFENFIVWILEKEDKKLMKAFDKLETQMKIYYSNQNKISNIHSDE